MSSKYLEQDLVNILASMTMRLPNYPSIFYETGYKIEFIEKEFDVTQDGKVKEVKFDIVLNNLDKNHSIPCECKSGGTDPEQLKKYNKLTSEELVRVGGVSSNDPTFHTHDITVVFNESNIEQILQETVGFPFVHLSVSKDPTLVTMVFKEFQDDDLSDFFSKPIEYPELVYEVFRVNGQTPVFKYINLVANELVSLSVKGKEEFRIHDIAQGVSSLTPGIYPAKIGEQMRNDILKKVDKVLTEGSNYELKEYFEWDRRKKVGKLRRIKPGCKPSSYRKFKDQAKEMSERLRIGSPVDHKYLKKKDRVDPNQLSLFNDEEEI